MHLSTGTHLVIRFPFPISLFLLLVGPAQALDVNDVIPFTDHMLSIKQSICSKLFISKPCDPLSEGNSSGLHGPPRQINTNAHNRRRDEGRTPQ